MAWKLSTPLVLAGAFGVAAAGGGLMTSSADTLEPGTHTQRIRSGNASVGHAEGDRAAVSTPGRGADAP